MPEKGLGLAKNETFSTPQPFFPLCHKGVLNWYSKGTRAKWNDLCLVVVALPVPGHFHKDYVCPQWDMCVL